MFEAINAAFKKKRLESKKSIDLLDEIITAGGISDTHLRMLVDEIIITDVEGKLDLEICLKAAFRRHYDLYDDFMVLIDQGWETKAITDWHLHEPGEYEPLATHVGQKTAKPFG